MENNYENLRTRIQNLKSNINQVSEVYLTKHTHCTQDMFPVRQNRKGGFSCQNCQKLLQAGYSTSNCKFHQRTN